MRCVRSQDNPGQPDDSDRRAGRTVVRTFAKKKEVRAAEEVSGRLSDQPLCRRWKAHRSVSCDKKLGASWFVPLVGPRLVVHRHGRRYKDSSMTEIVAAVRREAKVRRFASVAAAAIVTARHFWLVDLRLSISSASPSQSSAESLASSEPNNSVTALINADSSRSAISISAAQFELQKCFCESIKSASTFLSSQRRQILTGQDEPVSPGPA